MTRRTSLLAAVAVVGFVGCASAADNTNKIVYVGGHNPAAIVRTEPAPTAPYALTGSQRTETAKTQKVETLWVGNRFVGTRVVEK